MNDNLNKRLSALEGAPGHHNDKWRELHAKLHFIYGEPGEPFEFDETLTDAQHRSQLSEAIERVYGEG
jgi:hypothetical protein